MEWLRGLHNLRKAVKTIAIVLISTYTAYLLYIYTSIVKLAFSY